MYKSQSKFNIPHWKSSSKVLTLHLLLLLSGDTSINPGPIQNQCNTCAKPIRSIQISLQCDGCDGVIEHILTCPKTSTFVYQDVMMTGSVKNVFYKISLILFSVLTDR